MLSYTHAFNRDGNLEFITDHLDSSSSGGSRSFRYDEIHRLVSATGLWGVGEACPGYKTYTYDKNGNRTCNGESGSAANFTYSSTSNRLDTSAHPSYNYYPCNNPKPPMVCPPPRFVVADLLYFHPDHLGTPIAMTDGTGELVWKAEYTPFGELFSTAIAEVDNRLRFPATIDSTQRRGEGGD